MKAVVFVLEAKPPRRWRSTCCCGFAVRAQTRNAVDLAMAGHIRRAEGRHVASAPWYLTESERQR